MIGLILIFVSCLPGSMYSAVDHEGDAVTWVDRDINNRRMGYPKPKINRGNGQFRLNTLKKLLRILREKVFQHKFFDVSPQIDQRILKKIVKFFLEIYKTKKFFFKCFLYIWYIIINFSIFNFS